LQKFLYCGALERAEATISLVKGKPKAKEAGPRIQPYTNSFHSGLAALTDNASAREVVGFKRLTPKCGAGPRRRLPLLSVSGLVAFPESAGTFGASSGEPMTFKAGTLHLVLGKSGTFSEAALLFGQTISDSFLFNSPVARKFSRTGRRVLKG
jgi:hypothetical protein